MNAALQAFIERISQSTVGRFNCLDVVIDYAGASVGGVAVLPHTADADTALERADQAMYRVKQARRAVADSRQAVARKA